MQRHNRNAGQVDCRFDHRRHLAIAFIGLGEAFDRIEIGHIVIADSDRDWRGKAAQPLSGGGKFAGTGAHRDVAGDDDGIGALLRDLAGKPVERGAVFGPKMRVAGVKQSDGH